MNTFYDISINDISGHATTLTAYRGKVLLIVNVASHCGFTPQYQGLEALYQRFKDQGLVILGFPCNQFGGQEPGKDSEIQQFCELNYGVSFPLFSKLEVNGPGTHPLYQLLKAEKKGLLGTQAIKWNFTKFLVSRTGDVLQRFAPNTKPEALAPAIEAALRK